MRMLACGQQCLAGKLAERTLLNAKHKPTSSSALGPRRYVRWTADECADRYPSPPLSEESATNQLSHDVGFAPQPEHSLTHRARKAPKTPQRPSQPKPARTLRSRSEGVSPPPHR
jgi:hypothetical protein